MGPVVKAVLKKSEMVMVILSVFCIKTKRFLSSLPVTCYQTPDYDETLESEF